MESPTRTWDGNEAVADVAYRLSEVVAIYPITPASPMGEHADAWADDHRPNLWGQVPSVVEMQSEGGAAGAVHGALQAGALTTTFTASQGLLLMIPNLYKIVGELTPFVLHVAARSVATHALSIFADHSDVYAARQTGMTMLCANSVQEAHDLALVAHAATLRTRVPVLHFFDGFRTSHEVAGTRRLPDEALAALISDEDRAAHRQRALTPDRPVVRGTAQNPDVFFQAREAANPVYDAVPAAVAELMDRFGDLTGRRYGLVDYVGHPEAERVLVMMGSGAETAHETVDWMVARGDKVGLVKVRLYRPFPSEALLAALPATVRTVAVLDRTKEPGATGEPLYLDVVCALAEARQGGQARFAEPPRVVGGRYGLSSKEFDSAMVVGLFAALGADVPPNHFTVGINDDVSRRSLPWDPAVDIEAASVHRAVFYGLGSDGTVGAAKNSIKIIGESTDNHVQGFFVYDSKKSGAITVSHLRFGPDPIRATHLIKQAGFVGVHHWGFLQKLDVLERARPGAVLLVNAPYEVDEVWDRMPVEVQEGIRDKKLQVWVIDASAVARDAGMGRRTNTIMQTCFFALSGILPREEAIDLIKRYAEKTYARKGEAIVRRNHEAIDAALDGLRRLEVPVDGVAGAPRPPIVSAAAPAFVRDVTAVMMAGRGDDLPVSAMPLDGTWPTATSRWEKRTVADSVPQWDPDICIQCNKCAIVCPHAAIRTAVWDPAQVPAPPEGTRHIVYKTPPLKGLNYTIQVSPEDCTGCTLCAVVCPARDKASPKHKSLDMVPLEDRLEQDRASFAWFRELPEVDATQLKANSKDSQLKVPLFEFSGACAGCGETPYIKLLTQLYGDRLIIANATGCSSIYGGNLPTTPYTVNAAGRGPAWSNSLFEDNAEFGLGMRVAVDQLQSRARALLTALDGRLPDELVVGLQEADQADDAGILAQRTRVEALRALLPGLGDPRAEELLGLADYLVDKAVWIVGGDGWAYDIGYGGLDHALASGLDINILVLDTEVYSNTGGQQSKATPLGAVAKFAAGGKGVGKKDLGLLAMSYGGVYVAQVALGARDTQTAKALVEAQSHRGPSIVIAYSHCIAHGYDLANGLDQQAKAEASGAWPMYRYDPRRIDQGLPPMQLDSRPPRLPLRDYMAGEGRFRMLRAADPERAEALLKLAETQVQRRYATYKDLATPKES